MANPLVSVVIPTRNRSDYLLQALESVFAQTFTDYEIVVVDDGSTDNTRATLAPLVKQGKVRYEFQKQAGVSAARNRGVELAKGTYVAFLDSDDLFLPTKLEKQVAIFQKTPNLGFVHCSFSKFDDEGHDLGVRDTSRFDGQIYPQMLLEWSVLMAMPCMLMRREPVLAAGGFDEHMHWAEDLDLWRRIAMRHPIGVVPESLVKVRVHPNSTTFSKRGGIQGFERYLEKALADDPQLSLVLKRRATARMHAKLAQNLLGEGNAEDMRLARHHSLVSLGAWPLQTGALAALAASFLGADLRHKLATLIRRMRYSSDKG